MITRGRGSRSGAPNPADLLVCFPSRAHLTLMPKPICSPETNKLHSNTNKSQVKRMRGRGGGHGSPKLWGKTKAMGQEMDEPSSPKVTCAGQVRVRPRTARASCKDWQSVMEEIERIHKKGRAKTTKKSSWMEALGLKKDVMQFLTCLRSLRLDLSCFGSLPAGADITSDEDEDEDEEEEEDRESHGEGSDEDESSGTALSKWFMVLHENQKSEEAEVEGEGEGEKCVPPPNALMLMRCRSAPTKTWLEEQAIEQEEEENEEKERDDSVLTRYDTDYYKISLDIAKETWVVGGTRDLLSRSRSSKR